MRPVEGTILTVIRSIAEAAEALDDPSLVALLECAAVAGRDAVARTPELLPVLRDAGVVDAGGKGLTLLLDALLEVVDGRPIPEPELVETPVSVAKHLAGDDVSSLRYEVMYLLDADDDTMPAFREAWAAIGDSIVVVGGDGLWNCHVHTNDIGAAVEAGIEAGRPHTIRITDLIDQVEEERWVREAEVVADLTTNAPNLTPVTTAVVAVGVGDGVRRLLTSLGVQQVVAGGQSMNPSTAQILEAVEACASDAVVVLPNNKNIVAVARQVDALTDKRVAVVPTTSVPEALAALVEYDPNAELAGNEATMSQARERVSHGRGHPGRARQHRRRGRDPQGRLDRVCAATGSSRPRVRRPTRCASCSASWSTTTARSSPCSSVRTPPRTRPTASASTSRSRSRTSRSSSTMAGSRSTATSSAWSSEAPGAGR